MNIEKLGISKRPWTAQRGEGEINPINEIYVCNEDTECSETTICNFDETDYRKNHMSNAQLIAAAPEMLEALIDTILMECKLDCECEYSDCRKTGCTSLSSRINIIEKATGKTWEEIKELINE